MPIENIKILIIEDEATSRTLLRAMLKSIGLTNVTESEDAEAALKQLSQDTFDLILCDWMLPGMCGLELFKTTRKNEDLQSIPFLMVSGQSEKEQVIEAIKTGVDGYVLKPFSVNGIRKKLQPIIADIIKKKADVKKQTS